MRLSVHSGRLRALLAAGGVLVVLALAPAAHAATVGESGGKLSYVAGFGEANNVPPTIPPQTVGISASGVATVRVVCPAASGGCRGVVTITLPSTSSRRHAKLATAAKSAAVKIGSAKFKAAAGRSKSVPVRL